MALLPSLLGISTPSLFHASAPCCIAAFCRLNELRNLATAPATALATAAQGPAAVVQQQAPVAQHIPTLQQLQAAAAEAAAKNNVNQHTRRLIYDTVKTGRLGLVARFGTPRQGNVQEPTTLALHTFALHETVQTRRTLAVEDTAWCAINALKGVASSQEQAGLNPWEHNPRYLGNYPELVAEFHQRKRSPAYAMWQLRCKLKKHYLPRLNLTPYEFLGYDLDHIIPQSLGGPDHPGNLVVMPSSNNRRYQNHITPAKVREVGCSTMLMAATFYVSYHGLDNRCPAVLKPLQLEAARCWGSQLA